MTKRAVNCLALLTAGLLMLAALSWAQQGDPLRGEALYVGSVGFSEGGAPCLACHGIAGHALGPAANASYGPDLTSLYEDYGEEELLAVLEDLSFGSMTAIFADRPLTDEEKTDLTAFFGSIAAETAPDIGSRLVLHVLIVTVLIAALIGAFGWRRMKEVRRPLIAQAQNAKGEKA